MLEFFRNVLHLQSQNNPKTWVVFIEIAKIAQLVERNLAKVEVAGSSPVFRSATKNIMLEWWNW